MQSRGSLLLATRSRKGFAFFVIALFMLSLALQYAAAMVPSTALAADAPVVTLQDGVNGCQGVLPTPGSENTNKRLVGGSLVPGGSATFEISYPVSADDVSGRTTFVITDCVFIGGKAALKYEVSFVPNTENFILTFTLQIPAGTPIGAEYCNYAKTTAAPSKSPASNRKAGPACFVVGGNISILKTDENGQPLAGAKFHIVCTLPTTQAFLPDTIIDGVSHPSTSGGVITQDVTTDATGRIAIQAPEKTSCVITETDAPAGYLLPADPSVTLVASAAGVDHTFVDAKVTPSLKVTKGVSLSADGPFTASLSAPVGTTVHYRITIANTGNVDLTGVTLSDDKFNLVDKGCTVPTTLAVGAHFDCNYTSTVVEGVTTNTATGDSEETPPDSDTATVTGTTEPGFSVSKGVSLSADGPFTPSLTTEIGTTVFYRITITNTGTGDLTGVTLSDDKFDLVAKGCTIPTTLAFGAHYDCNYSTTAVAGVTTNTATGDTDQTPPDDDTATVTGHTSPGLSVSKGVSLSADGPFHASLAVLTGTTVHYRITITNTGNVELTGVTLSDSIFDLAEKGCTIPTTLAVGASFDCNYSNVATTGTTTNTATGDSQETGAQADTATVVATVTPPPPTLTIEKSNNAPIVNVGGTGLPTAVAGSTVTFTLAYNSQNGAVSNAVITDVLPLGLTYVADSATSNTDFSFSGYDAGTRTLTWNAGSVSTDGSVSYQAKVDSDAASRPQPLRNVATIDSDNTGKDTAHSDVFVPAPPLAETSVPTAPRTDILTSGGTSAPGMNLGLVLLVLAGLAFAIVFITPMPASVRNRIRRR